MRYLAMLVLVSLLALPCAAFCPGTSVCPYDGATSVFTGYTRLSDNGSTTFGQYRHQTFGSGAVNHVSWQQCP